MAHGATALGQVTGLTRGAFSREILGCILRTTQRARTDRLNYVSVVFYISLSLRGNAGMGHAGGQAGKRLGLPRRDRNDSWRGAYARAAVVWRNPGEEEMTSSS